MNSQNAIVYDGLRKVSFGRKEMSRDGPEVTTGSRRDADERKDDTEAVGDAAVARQVWRHEGESVNSHVEDRAVAGDRRLDGLRRVKRRSGSNARVDVEEDLAPSQAACRQRGWNSPPMASARSSIAHTGRFTSQLTSQVGGAPCAAACLVTPSCSASTSANPRSARVSLCRRARKSRGSKGVEARGGTVDRGLTNVSSSAVKVGSLVLH